MPEDPTHIGIVVIGRNEGKRLERCIVSLPVSRHPTIYVDSCSTDGSRAVAASLGVAVLALADDRPLTAARARADGAANLLCRHPGVEFILFIDGDCELEPAFLDAAQRAIADDASIAVVCGRRRERFPDASHYNQLIEREWDTPVGEAESCGGDALMRARSYQEVGGFDPDMLAGEEPELCSRLRESGWRIVRIAVPMTIHDAAILRFGQWWRRAVRSGMGYAQVWASTRHRSNGPLYGREITRALGWAAILPLGVLALAALVSPALVIAWPAAVAFQFLRLSRRDGVFSAALSVAGKYGELAGLLRFAGRTIVRRQDDTVNYK